MTKNRLLVGALLLTGIAAVVGITTIGVDLKSNYQEKKLSILEEQKAEDAMKWMRARYVDVYTGEPVSSDLLMSLHKQVLKLPKTKSISYSKNNKTICKYNWYFYIGFS